MAPQISVSVVQPRLLAAVRRRVSIGNVGLAWRDALDKVWTVLRSLPGLRTHGHNVFVYHHGKTRDAPMDVDFGVEVTRDFDAIGEVCPAQTPGGEVAHALHLGPYERLGETHAAIHRWAAENGRTFAGTSWEIYGDPVPDSAKLETTVMYLLAR